jgi:hypothetical protein
MSTEIKKCRCGKTPKFKNERRTFGHGECPKVWFLECSCGMRTKDLPEGYEGSRNECREKAIKIWNGVPG